MERVAVHASEERHFSNEFLYWVCQWLITFTQSHHCLLGCDPNSEQGRFLMSQLPEVKLYQKGEACADWFIDAYFDQSHGHLYDHIQAKVVSIALPSRDLVGKIRCDQILLDQAYMPQTFNERYFPHHKRCFNPVRSQGELIQLRPFRRESGRPIHKYDRGALILLGGSAPFASALRLSAKIAMMAGAGYVIAMSEDKLPVDHSGIIWAHLYQPQARYYFDRASVFVWGPGLLPNSPLLQWSSDLQGLHVIDAGALAFESEFNGEKILLMHAGEMAHFLNIDVDDVCQHRVKYALEVAYKTRALVLLKGDYPVLVKGSRFYIVDADFTPLNRAGTGDILAGLVGSFCAQGLTPFDAVIQALQVGNTFASLGRAVIWEDYEALFTGD